MDLPCADPEGRGQGVRTPPPEKPHKYRVYWQYWSGSPEIHTATKPVFNAGASSARQRNAIKMAFRWRTDDGPPIVIFRSSY